MPFRISCARCHRAGSVRLVTVIKGDRTVRDYECNRCGYSWAEHEEPAPDADRRLAKTDRRQRHPAERRTSA